MHNNTRDKITNALMEEFSYKNRMQLPKLDKIVLNIGFGRDGGYAQIRLSSGELRLVRQECMATVGAVSNPDNSNQNFGKAGRNRHRGIRPSVRGVVIRRPSYGKGEV